MTLIRSFVLALLGAASAFAGSGVSGRVFDPQGYAQPGATVKLETAAGYHATTTSDAEGHYIFVSVPIASMAPAISKPKRRGWPPST